MDFIKRLEAERRRVPSTLSDSVVYNLLKVHVEGTYGIGFPNSLLRSSALRSSIAQRLHIINSRQLEHGSRMIRAGIPVSIPFGVWGQGCSNFLEFTVCPVLENPHGLWLCHFIRMPPLFDHLQLHCTAL